MSVKVYIDGAVVDPQDARVSVFDRGFLFGDSVYETMRTAGGRLVDVEAHLRRLERSAKALALPLPAEKDLVAAMRATLAAAANEESSVRLVVTRGAGDIGLATDLAGAPNVIVIVRPLNRPPAEYYQRGAKLAVVAVQRTPKGAMDPAIKSGNYLNNIMALAEARREGAHEAVMCDSSGRLAEGSTSNIFVVKDRELATPALEIGLLPGITRSCVIDLARAEGLAVREGHLVPDDLENADEVFITSSIRGVLPISTISDIELPGPVPGPVTARLMELYQEHLDSHVQD